MRRKSAEFMGIGHPLVDAMVAHFQRSSWAGDVAVLKSVDGSAGLSVRFVLEATLEDGSSRRRYESADAMTSGSWLARSPKKDVDALHDAAGRAEEANRLSELPPLRDRVAAAIADAEAHFRTELSAVQTVRGRLVGLACVTA